VAAKNFIVKNGLTVGSTEVVDSSADLTAAAFGTAANEAIDDRVNALLTAGTGVSLSYDDAAGTLTINGQVGDIQGVTAGDGLSGGGTSGTVSLAVDLNELSAATVDVANDSIPIIDAGDSSSKKESIADLVSGIAGNGLAASSGALAVDLNELTAAAVDLGNDSVAIIDASDSNNPKKESLADIATAQAGTGISASSGVFATDSIAHFDTDDLGEGSSNLYHTTARARAAISAGGDLSYNSSTGVISFTNDAGDIESVTAGDGLSGGGTSGALTVALDLNELTAATVDVANDLVPIIDAGDSSSKKESIADIVTGIAGDGLAASSGVLAVGVDDSSIETNSDALRVKASGVTNAMLAGSIANSKLANSSITIAGSATALGGTVLANTDALSEGSSNLYYTDERVADKIGAIMSGSGSTTVTYDDAADTITISSTGKTTEEIQDIAGAMFTSNTETGITATYEDGDGTIDLVVGTLNQDTTGTADNITVTANNSTDETVYPIFVDGATGSQGAESDTGLTYNPSSGVLTSTQFTGALSGNATTATALATARTINGVSFDGSANVTTLTAGTGVSVSGTAVSIGQAVATTSDVTFADIAATGNVVVTGNFTVNGTTTTVSSTNTTIEDALIELGNGTSGSPANDAGFVIERGDSDNVFIGWDESADVVTIGTGSFTGASTGNLTHTVANFTAGVGTFSSLDISGNADIDGTLEADAFTVDGTALNEYIADTVGAMVSSNTETGITVSYEDGDNTLDFVVGTLNQDTTGTADNFTVTANNSTDETVYPVFVDGATGSQGAETDTGLSYNPSSGMLTTAGITSTLTGTATGLAGTPNISVGTIASGAHTITNATNAGGVSRNIYQSTSAPSGGDGAVGDLWILYS
tara:strand:- start:191 stop:2836 length:2646 start_codon:yes stop_codon:yes gene_type:complete